MPTQYGLLLPHFGPHCTKDKLIEGAKKAEAFGFELDICARPSCVPSARHGRAQQHIHRSVRHAGHARCRDVENYARVRFTHTSPASLAAFPDAQLSRVHGRGSPSSVDGHRNISGRV